MLDEAFGYQPLPENDRRLPAFSRLWNHYISMRLGYEGAQIKGGAQNKEAPFSVTYFTLGGDYVYPQRMLERFNANGKLSQRDLLEFAHDK